MVPGHTNRLIHATSPYLLQHAHNPVDWYPWGEEALGRAREQDRPILLSIGYAACHWCHVMERESFERETIAALMNAHFVCIKVDREERPDLDDVYMAATLALNRGQGGWPMTVFLTPDLTPFFAGTYFPPADRHGMPGFATLLERITSLWRDDRAAVVAQGAEVRALLEAHAGAAAPLPVAVGEIEAAAAELARQFDHALGGFGPAPKFPPTAALSLLLRHQRRNGDAHALAMVRTTLDRMAAGGIYDHIGGGFARYSTDERWLVPHFEKMLYDNALLARIYLDAHRVTGEPHYARVARAVLDFVLRELIDCDGGFHSAVDADSEGEEGRFYVWRPAEIEAVLGPEAGRRFCAYYDITEAGNWEGRSVPNTPRAIADVAARLGIAPADLETTIESGRPRVYEARHRRVPPAVDDKVITAWHGLMIGALADGARVLDEPRYLAAAVRAADFLLATLVDRDGRLLRTYRAGRAHLPAYLEDHAYLCEALVDLYEAGARLRYLEAALRLAGEMLARFRDVARGAFYSTAGDHETLLFRHCDGRDGATPSANAVAARVLARLAHHYDRPDLRDAAVAAIEAYGREMTRHPSLFATALGVVDLLAEGPVELVLVGTPGEPGYDDLRRAVTRRYLPNCVVAHLDPAAAESAPAPGGSAAAGEGGLPLLAGKKLLGGRAALYVCRNFACEAPVTDAAVVPRALEPWCGPVAAGEGDAVVGALCPGSASAAATAAYAARMHARYGSAAYGRLGVTGLTVSRLGFGTYRIDDETPAHREALAHALLAGVNIIDTSTNYTDGGSERAVGAVLAELRAAGRLAREDAVVVSKIGYVQGRTLLRASAREAAGRPVLETVKYAEDVWHCIHPEFLVAELQRSRARLGLATLDVCLLHNPEYFLSHAAARGEPLAASRDEFYRRLEQAFRFFETQVGAGTIRWYGVSSNTAAAATDAAEATSLARMLEAARRAGGAAHRFRVLELPLNLFESGAVAHGGPEDDPVRTVLDLAAGEGVAVLINRPLNAFVNGTLFRFADVEATAAAAGAIDVPPDPEPQRRVVAAVEAEFRREIAPLVRTAPGSTSPAEFFRWGERLDGAAERIGGIEQWQQVELQIIAPSVAQFLAALDRACAADSAETWGVWRQRYVLELGRLLAVYGAVARRRSRAARAALAAALDPLLPPERHGETLSRQALWVLASTPGVGVVLAGMRRRAYVDDAVEILRWAPLTAAEIESVYRSMRSMRAVQATAAAPLSGGR